MKTFLTIIALTFGILYVVMPYDLIPNFIPVIGWIDDIAVAALMIYYLRYGRMPGFIQRFFGRVTGSDRRGNGRGYDNADEKRQYQGYGETGGKTSGDAGRKTPHEVLGVPPGATEKEIHSAYRKLVQQYHPDKVSHMGQEIQETARRKFVEIQAAYDALKGR